MTSSEHIDTDYVRRKAHGICTAASYELSGQCIPAIQTTPATGLNAEKNH